MRNWGRCAELSLLGLLLGCQGGVTDVRRDAQALPDARPADTGVREPDAGAAEDTGPPADGGFDIPDAGDAHDGGEHPDATVAPQRRITILMIGDGMGRGQLEAASLYAHGRRGALVMEQMPHHGELVTGSLSGFTDSAASATAMATGFKTHNRKVGLDRNLAPLETLVELAKANGQAAGVVTSALLPHATPGAFSAHRPDRDSYVDIATDQATTVQPDVMLGGGSLYFLPAGADSSRTDEGVIAPLQSAGYAIVTTRAQLIAQQPDDRARLFGMFAPEHMDYVLDRDASTTQPSLAEMSLAAIRFLDTREEGFFLMIEGARIDMAAHLNDRDRMITETVDFDQAIQAVLAWAAASADEVTVIVTADHECGGVVVTQPAPAGAFSTVTWRWTEHTNARVDVFAMGPGSEVFDGTILDNTWVHAVLSARITGTPIAQPRSFLVPDGHLAELSHLAAVQTAASGFGVGHNQLESLRLDADANGLAIGVEGLFGWGQNAVVVLLDVDFGSATGPAQLRGAFSDRAGRVDGIVSSLNLDSPLVPGFGADFALVAWGGIEARDEDLLDDTGLRGLIPPYGAANDFAWYRVAANFGEGVRTQQMTPVQPGEGLELYVPWETLYPGRSGGVPNAATLGIAVVLVNDDGGFTSNQALPSFPATTANPGRNAVALPGVVTFAVDANGDGVGDGASTPIALP